LERKRNTSVNQKVILKGGFGYAIGIGYVVSNVDLGVRYQGGKPGGDNQDGSDWSFIGIHVGYNFTLGGK
jgi:hypothetical protein